MKQRRKLIAITLNAHPEEKSGRALLPTHAT